MRSDIDLLGESAAYPGHPVTLGYLIFKHFRSMGEASERPEGHQCPRALSSSAIPGAGGCVYDALRFLRDLKEGVEFTEAVDRANTSWGQRDNHKEDDLPRYHEGQKQADRVGALFQSELDSDWFVGEP